MPDEKEVLGFELEFLADTKVLERLKKILGETFENTKNLEEAIKALKESAKGYNLKALTTQNEQLSKSYEKQRDNLLKLAKALGTKKTRQPYLNKLTEKFGFKKEGVYDGKSTAQESAKKTKGELTQKSSFYKKGELAFSRDVYSKIAKEGNKTIKTSEVWKDDETLEKVVEKTTYALESLPEEIQEVINEINVIKRQTKPDATGNAVETKTYRQIVDQDGKRITRNVTTVDGQVSSYSTSEKAIEKTIEKTTYALEELPETIKAVVNDLYKIKTQIKSDKTGKPIETKTYRQVVDENGKRITRDVTTVDGKISSYSESEKDIEEKLGKSKSSNTSKFLSRVKNIVIYRLVRVAMSAIAKGINEGFELLSTNNSAYKDVINSLKASTTALSVTFAQLLLPVAESLSSILEGLTTKLIDSANAMALQQAMLNGEQKYFKLSKKSIDEYAKSLSNANKSLSQLDKFATLSQGKPILGSFEDVSSATTEELENVEETSKTILGLKNALVSVASSLITIAEFISKINNLSNDWGVTLTTTITAALAAISFGVIGLETRLSKFKVGMSIITLGLYTIIKIVNSELSPALKWISGILIGIATLAAFIAALAPGGKVRLASAAIAAGAAVVGLGVVAGGEYGNKLSKNVDTGASQASYDNPLASGGALASNDQDLYNNVQRSRTVTTQTSTSDVYLDGNKVGKALTKTVFSYGAKGGYL